MTGLKTRIIKFLRGHHNSVRYRFYILPREWLIYLFCFRMIGRSWLEFYAWRMNRSAKQGGHKPVPDRYVDDAQGHFEFLKTQGLLPHHHILDYGCGFMRTGVFLVPYLDDKHYVGVDISGQRLKSAAQLAKARNLQDGSFVLIELSSCRLDELDGRHFDYIWAGSVIHHMPEPDIRIFLRNLKSLINDDSQFFFTFTPAEKGQYERRRIKDFYYPVDEMRNICESEGYRFEFSKGWEQLNRSDQAVRLVLAD
jgi:SAM-dependent methyltransferase